ncbi:MAG: class II aldolase/adducin family protein [Akkermansiaceae bacterium]|nr:class II aldolase/adducin family protein [Akkermansiaceae bacterium]
MSPTEPLPQLLDLSHELGREERKLAILSEGNTSARISGDSFWVKASGSNLATLCDKDVTECRSKPLIELLNTDEMENEAIDKALLESRVSMEAKKPSMEAMFHAYLLSLPDVNYVAHTHPVAVNALLCSKHARSFAQQRLFPDEVVCCGTESVFVAYRDPGLELSKGVRLNVEDFIDRTSRPPHVILLENHGMIALGATPRSVLAATLMTVKAAEIHAGAAAISDQPQYLSTKQVERIAGRPDEHYRQKALGL